MKNKLYLSAPLPFVGQKRMFAREFIKVLKQFPDDVTFVDLFGGSGLLSHIAKRCKPNATVVYNDFDNYRKRLENIPRTNRLIADIREIVGNTVPRHKAITGDIRERIFDRIQREERENGYVDFITLSASIMFSMKYKLSVAEMRKDTLYNNIRKNDYPECLDYLEGLEITSRDYREVFNEYKDTPGAVFLVDPPYLSTEVGTYTMYWKLSDYLDVLTVLTGHSFIYFTSNKSSILELCEWIGKNQSLGNPFKGCMKSEFNAHINYNATYTDIMLYKRCRAHDSGGII
nr:MAG TPA: DNA adenine methylase [Caudoviricetes sp.]